MRRTLTPVGSSVQTRRAWRVGVALEGISNDGRYGVWVIKNVVDDPHQTRFDAEFYSSNTSWVSFYCA